MGARYLAEALGPAALAAQANSYGRTYPVADAPEPDALGADERAFIAERDSFYIATVMGSGWPYVQHRGGPKGFLHVLDEHTLGFADLKGNRQLVTTGNIADNDRAALILVDYPRRERLKILARVRVVEARADETLADSLAPAPELRGRVERSMLLDVVGIDWNCPAYITPRYSADEVESALGRMQARIRELEAKLHGR